MKREQQKREAEFSAKQTALEKEQQRLDS